MAVNKAAFFPATDASWTSSAVADLQQKRLPPATARVEVLYILARVIFQAAAHTAYGAARVAYCGAQLALYPVWKGAAPRAELILAARHASTALKSATAAVVVTAPALIQPSILVTSYKWLGLYAEPVGILGRIANTAKGAWNSPARNKTLLLLAGSVGAAAGLTYLYVNNYWSFAKFTSGDKLPEGAKNAPQVIGSDPKVTPESPAPTIPVQVPSEPVHQAPQALAGPSTAPMMDQTTPCVDEVKRTVDNTTSIQAAPFASRFTANPAATMLSQDIGFAPVSPPESPIPGAIEQQPDSTLDPGFVGNFLLSARDKIGETSRAHPYLLPAAFVAVPAALALGAPLICPRGGKSNKKDAKADSNDKAKGSPDKGSSSARPKSSSENTDTTSTEPKPPLVRQPGKDD